MDVHIGTRQELMAELTRALAPGSPMSLLAIFRLGGLREYVAEHDEEAADDLVRRTSERLAMAIGPTAVYYRPRRDELCGLISGPLEGAKDTLYEAVMALNAERDTTGITAGFGVALLPFEADDPISALKLADERLSGLVELRKPKKRTRRSRSRASERDSEAA
jgi:GGDEF domain-containing protein